MRFSSSFVAFVYLGLAAAAALPSLPTGSTTSLSTPSLPRGTPGLSARNDMKLPKAGSMSITPASVPTGNALKGKVARRDSSGKKALLDATGKVVKGDGKGGPLARRDGSLPEMSGAQASTQLPTASCVGPVARHEGLPTETSVPTHTPTCSVSVPSDSTVPPTPTAI